MIGGLDIKLYAGMLFKVAIILFTFISGIHRNPLNSVIAFQILHKRNQRMNIISVCAYVASDDEFF